MERLRHRAEDQPQARGLGPGEAEGHFHLLHGKAQELSRRGGSPEPAESRSEMPTAVVVLHAHAHADVGLHFETHDERFEHRFSGKAFPLPHCQGRGDHGSAGMAEGPRVGVVEIQGVGQGAVHQGGVYHAGLEAMEQDARLGFPPELLDGLHQDLAQGLMGASQGDPYEVQEAALSLVNNIFGNGLVR